MNPPPFTLDLGFPAAGKEVALFVQEHMAEELVKLEEYREGDFPGALVRCVEAISHSIQPFVASGLLGNLCA